MFNFPAGIPIPHDVHEQYALNVKTAWTKFHEWWVKARDDADGELVDPNKMPTDVRKAFDLINETPIPARRWCNWSRFLLHNQRQSANVRIASSKKLEKNRLGQFYPRWFFND